MRTAGVKPSSTNRCGRRNRSELSCWSASASRGAASATAECSHRGSARKWSWCSKTAIRIGRSSSGASQTVREPAAPPHELPAAKTISTLRSASTPGAQRAATPRLRFDLTTAAIDLPALRAEPRENPRRSRIHNRQRGGG